MTTHNTTRPETLLLPPGGGETVYLLHQPVSIKITGDQTGDTYTLTELLVPPGAGPAPHLHRQHEEAFYILEGEMTFYGAGAPVKAPKGSFVQVPSNVLHGFRNETEQMGRLLVFHFPGSFGEFFREVSLPEVVAPTQENFAAFIRRSVALGPKYATEYYSFDIVGTDPEAPQPRIVRPGEGEQLTILRQTAEILANGEQTDGAYVFLENIAPPGDGVPPHIHYNEDESFYVVEGEATFMLPDGTETVAGPGSFLYSPKGTPHAWYNRSNEMLHLLVLATPSGFDSFFRELSQVTAPEQIVPLATRHGIEFVAGGVK